MELGFTPDPMCYLQQVLWDCQCREETADTIVPDSYPDVSRIVSCHALAVMRSKECRQGSAVVNGGIRTRVLYVAEGESMPRCLEVYLPYTIQADGPGLTENSIVQFSSRIKSADARMVNSRKIVVRVNLCYELGAYEPAQAELYRLDKKPEELQLRQAEYRVPLPVEGGERSFQLSEELNLPTNHPLMGEICHFSPRLELLEKRLSGNKAVFKGLVHLTMLYLTQGDVPVTYSTEIPFSQYCELGDVYDDEELNVSLEMTGCDLERIPQGDGEGLLLTMHLLSQCLVSAQKALTLQEDAYTIRGDFAPQWKQYEFSTRLDRQTLNRTVRDSRELSAREVADARVYLDAPRQKRLPDGVEVQIPATAQILYYDENGDLQGVTHRMEFTEKISLADNVECRIKADLGGDVAAMPTGSTLEIRFPLSLEVECLAKTQFRTLCGGQMTKGEEKPGARPSIIVRRTRTGESLWDIAKANGTTVERIRSANRLNSEEAPAGILLIPT